MPEETEIDPPVAADEPTPETPAPSPADAPRTTIELPDVPPPFGIDQFKLLADQSHFGGSRVDAMEIDGIGCLVRSYSMIVFVPGVRIKDVADEMGNIVGRKLIQR